jgi:hypothetical protein
MKKQEAIEIANHISQYSVASHCSYEISNIRLHEGPLRGFHQWADGKELVDAFCITKPGQDTFYVLFIDWHRNGNYYLVVYAHDKSTTYAEIQQTVTEGGAACLLWKYNPLKRDGKNFERKAFFKQRFGSTEVRIPFPESKENVEPFLDGLFSLVRHRLQADRIPRIYENFN